MEPIKFRMNGAAFEEGIPLHLALSSMQDVQSIFDQTYLVMSGRKRITKRDRAYFHLKTKDIRHGSLESELQVYLNAAQHTLPVVAALTSSDLWGLTKDGWELLRWFYAKYKPGSEPTYQVGDNGTLVIVQGDNNIVTTNATLDVAKAALPHWRDLNHKLEQGAVDSYTFGDPAQPDLGLTSPNRAIFDNLTRVESVLVEFICDIYDYNKRANVGRLNVKEGDIPEGDYTFEVIGQQDKLEYIASMARPEVRVSALQEVSDNPLGGSVTTRLHIAAVS